MSYIKKLSFIRLYVYFIVKKSGLFDYNYYLRTYSDIRCADVDPLKHYLRSGWLEGRNPSSVFDTEYYLRNNLDAKEAGINPLYHYVKYGRDEGRKANETDDVPKIIAPIKAADNKRIMMRMVRERPDYLKIFIKNIFRFGLFPAVALASKKVINYKERRELSLNLPHIDYYLNHFHDEPFIPKLITDEPIDILIPVFNNKDMLEALFDSLLRNTTLPYRLIIMDDCSTDDTILPFLYEFKEYKNQNEIIILENKVNLGFVKTVNKMVEYTNNNFVLLNTDIVLPPYWIERLMYPIFEMESIASVTPFTNSATIFSFPIYYEDNELFEGLNLDEIDQHFQQVNLEKTYIEVPTGVGFCMGINKKVVDQIGMFDEVFGRGYGEENDWCQRALKEGYKNIHVTNLFVYHKHGSSFSLEEKNKLCLKNMNILLKKHPTYMNQVAKTVSEDRLRSLREILKIKLLSDKYGCKFIIDHSIGGGANEYRNEVIGKNEIILLMTYNMQSKMYELTLNGKFINDKITYISDDYKVLNRLFQLFSCNEIIINNLVSYPKVIEFIEYILKIAESFSISIKYLIHDYYCVCPIYYLISFEMEFCDVPSDLSFCDKCLRKNPLIRKSVPFVKDDYPDLTIDKWRNGFGRLLLSSDKVITFSNSSKNIINKCYKIPDDNYNVMPHKVDWVYSVTINKSNDSLNIAVLGVLTFHKGINIIAALGTFVDANKLNIKIHIFGNPFDGESLEHIDCIKKHGTYNKSNLPNLMQKNEIDIVLIPSICPETFSYTTEEAIKMGLPVAVFNLGAQAEKVMDYNNGIILDSKDPEIILKSIFALLVKLNESEHNHSLSLNKSNVNNNIAFVCVSNNELMYSKSIASNHYIIKNRVLKYDNRVDNVPIPRRYNSAINFLNAEKYEGWIIFTHNDFSLLEDINSALNNLERENIYGPIGAYLNNGIREIRGQVFQWYNGLYIKHGTRIKKPAIVDTLDCQCLIMHTALINKYKLRFDENEALSFHQYVEEICLNARTKHNVNSLAIPIKCSHLSWGKLDANYYKAYRYLLNKYPNIDWAGTCTHLKTDL